MHEPSVSYPRRATRFLWDAAGRPPPYTTDGALIAPRDMAVEAQKARARLGKKRLAAEARGDLGEIERLELQIAQTVDNPRCASCGEPASYLVDDAISDSFTTMRNASRAWAYGGSAVCAGCVWCCRSLALRCCLWFARIADERGRGGIWFVPMRPIPGCPSTRPDVFDALLNPPPPPFVAGLPLFGVDHGGEQNAHRAVWPWKGETPDPSVRDGLYVPSNALVKLQSKHTALYAEVSTSRVQYRLQVDDALEVTVDVPLWRRLRAAATDLIADLRAGGVGAQSIRGALTHLEAPMRAPRALIAPAAWRHRTKPFRPHAGSTWWGLFVQLLPIPDLPTKDPA